jgi:hypothetical protein
MTTSLFMWPLSEIGDCATGRHHWLPTEQVGITVCVFCGLMGYCQFCTSGNIPPGAPLRPCRFHRHAGLRLDDSPRLVSAIRRIQR